MFKGTVCETALQAIKTVARLRSLPVFAVGGAVRDLLLERTTDDLDLLVLGDAWKLAQEAAVLTQGHWFVLDDQHQTLRIICQEKEKSFTIDLVGIPNQKLGENLRERDFTINAMAMEIEDYQAGQNRPRNWIVERIIDPCGGLKDLDASLVRAVSRQGLEEDPIRLLRAIRLAGQLNFHLEDQTRTFISSLSEGLKKAAAERIRDEFFKILALPHATRWIREMEATGLLNILLPELTATQGISQNVYHELDVYNHSLAVLEKLETYPAESENWLGENTFLKKRIKDYLGENIADHHSRWVILKLAALIHDTGKPATRQEQKEGKITFYGHEKVGGKIARNVANRLRLSRREEQLLVNLVEQHMRPLHLFLTPHHTQKARFRFFKQLEADTLGVVMLSLADRQAGRSKEKEEETKSYFKFAGELLKTYIEDYQEFKANKLIDGHEIIKALGLKPGPRIGKILEYIETARIENKITTREEALEAAKQFVLHLIKNNNHSQ